jgi:hypothetical protein
MGWFSYSMVAGISTRNEMEGEREHVERLNQRLRELEAEFSVPGKLIVSLPVFDLEDHR